MAAPTIVDSADHASSPSYRLGNFSIDESRPIRVVAIGAGYSGIIAGIRFCQRVQNVDITVYDSNSGVGGTWWVNRYPGLCCDVPSHSYQISFEDNPDWSAFYAPGPEIQQYLERVVDKYQLRQHIKLRHRVMRAAYDEPTGKWHFTLRRPRPGSETEKGPGLPWDWKTDYEEFEDTADVFFAGLGALSRWSWPDIDGLETFKGKVLHSANWETGLQGNEGWEAFTKDWEDKRVGVIGVGSSAIQIVPALQRRVKHLTNYVRGKTWVSAAFLKERLLKLSNGENVSNYFFTEEDKDKFSDTAYYRNFRWQVESELNSCFAATVTGHPASIGAKAAFREDMLRRLAKKPWIAEHIMPDFSPICRRLTPGPGYLEALCEDNVDFVPVHIKRITPNGIETVDGKHQDLDILICATGFDASFQYDFPITGRGGVDLNTKHTPHPKTYLSVAVDGFPNMFQSLGPNAAVGVGSLLIIIERQVDYAVAATLKMQRERLKSMEVKAEAVDDFDEYLEHYFPTSVYGEKCKSWYKAGKEEGRVVAIWPGSSLHAVRALAHPRWEDYSYEPLDETKNRLYWLGDGSAVADHDENGDRAFYLKEVDYPPIPPNAKQHQVGHIETTINGVGRGGVSERSVSFETPVMSQSILQFMKIKMHRFLGPIFTTFY